MANSQAGTTVDDYESTTQEHEDRAQAELTSPAEGLSITNHGSNDHSHAATINTNMQGRHVASAGVHNDNSSRTDVQSTPGNADPSSTSAPSQPERSIMQRSNTIYGSESLLSNLHQVPQSGNMIGKRPLLGVASEPIMSRRVAGRTVQVTAASIMDDSTSQAVAPNVAMAFRPSIRRFTDILDRIQHANEPARTTADFDTTIAPDVERRGRSPTQRPRATTVNLPLHSEESLEREIPPMPSGFSQTPSWYGRDGGHGPYHRNPHPGWPQPVPHHIAENPSMHAMWRELQANRMRKLERSGMLAPAPEADLVVRGFGPGQVTQDNRRASAGSASGRGGRGVAGGRGPAEETVEEEDEDTNENENEDEAEDNARGGPGPRI